MVLICLLEGKIKEKYEAMQNSVLSYDFDVIDPIVYLNENVQTITA